MRGKLVMLLVLFSIIECWGCNQRELNNSRVGSKQGGGKVSILETIIKALARPDATVGSVAKSIGKPQEQIGGEYKVKPNDPLLDDVRVGILYGGDLNTSPPYVQIYLRSTTGDSLDLMLPKCEWRQIPANPDASPFVYSCFLPKQDSRSARITAIAQFNADRSTPDAHLESIILQRGTVE